MTQPLPKWVMSRYSILWNVFEEKEFRRENAMQALENDKMVNITLSKLRQAGWLVTSIDPNDARKRIYRLKNPNQAVKEIGKGG